MRPEHRIKQHLMEKRAGLVPDHRIPAVVTHLRPTVNETFDTMPKPSSASRVPSAKSPFNTRATAVNPLNDTIIFMESALELKAGKILKTMDVVELREQVKIEWIDLDGVVHAHTFDFWIRKRCGKRVAIAVKPFGKLASKRLIDMLILIKDQGIGGIADDVSFITEHFASEYAAANAEEILLRAAPATMPMSKMQRSFSVRSKGAFASASFLKGSKSRRSDAPPSGCSSGKAGYAPSFRRASKTTR